MLIETLSQPFTKANPTNIQQDVYRSIVHRFLPPSGDGVHEIGHGGSLAANRLYLMPLAEGIPGVAFAMRLYGWRPIGTESDKRQRQVWVWNLLAEFVCITGNCPGPRAENKAGTNTEMALTSAENLCDGIALTRGVLGLSGFINSGYPGSGIPACAAVELYGCRYVSFDFAQMPNGGVGMNCLFARC